MKEKTGFVTRLMEYGLLITILHKGFLIVSGILYFTVVSGILTYTIAINEPMAIGKITLLSLLLILSIILTKLIPFRVHTLKSVETRRRKKPSTRESLTIVISLLVILVLLVLSYAMICFFRIY
jgi:uncharacterized membrane protein YidH (DUF202 family)